MSGATLPSTDGAANWVDNIHNWRAEDAEFLQSRSILRFSDATNRNVTLGPTTLIGAPQAGQAAYLADTDTLTYADSLGQWRTLITFQYLSMTDTDTSVSFRHTSDVTDTLVIQKNSASLGPSQKLTVDTDGVKIKTGAATALLTTNASSLVASTSVTVPSITVNGEATTDSITNAGTLATASITASGAGQLGSLTVSGTSALQGAVTALSLATTGAITTTTTMTATTSVRGGSVIMTGNDVRSYTDPTSKLTMTTGVATLAATAINLSPADQNTPVKFKSGTIDIPFVTAVVSATDPGVANYPEGTLWIVP